jgi:phage shock protein E
MLLVCDMKKRSVVLASLLCIALLSISSCQHAPAPAISSNSPSHYEDPDALFALIAKKSEPYNLVDVRSPQEYSTGHIPTAINRPVDEIAVNPPSRDSSMLIIVYCRSGTRSARAAAILKELGYTRVVQFGAISRWKGPLVESSEPGDLPPPAR